MSKSQSIYIWNNVDRIILRIESLIGFEFKTTNVYYSQYWSKKDEDCSLQSSRFIRESARIKNHLVLRMDFNHIVHPLMNVYPSWNIVFSLDQIIIEIYFHHLAMNYYLHQEILHCKFYPLFIHWNRRISVIIIIDVSCKVVLFLMTLSWIYPGRINWNATTKKMIVFYKYW